MKKILTALLALCAAASASAEVEFDKYFDGRTLRLDYIFAGDDKTSAIFLEQAGVSDGWAGRRHNLERPFIRGNGGIFMTDAATGDTIYSNSFATLFQEWQVSPEAAYVPRAYETTYLLPYPREKVNIIIELYNNRGEKIARTTHPLDPADILIRHIPPTKAPAVSMHRGGSPEECVDIAILAEGYTPAEMGKFYSDARRAADAILSHEPFASMSDKFNITAVGTPSGDSGPDIPGQGIWNRTAHGSHYDTFYSDRYLTTQSIHSIHESLAGLPYEHIILLVNTPKYGGGGIFNQITISASDMDTFKEVLVHEFGHAYGGLADEYNYAEDDDDGTYPIDIEPWEPNITTLTDFGSKWADMLPESTVIPTPVTDETPLNCLGVYEGAGYKAKGVYRPVPSCRMRDNDIDYFCPVCTKAIVGITEWYTGK